MTKYKPLLLLFLPILTFSVTSCENDEVDPDVTTGSVIVINEGAYGHTNGSISMYNPDDQTIENNVFDKVNGTGALSASIQSVSIYENKAFLICNAADKIEIVDAVTFERIAAPMTTDSLISPRYMAATGNKAYVTVWGPYGEGYVLSDSKVAVLDLTDYTIVKMIDTDAGPEGILAVDQKVFVANSLSNTVTVINTQTDAVDTTLVVNTGPHHLALDKNNMLWVSTTGGFGGGDSQFIRIDPTTYAISTTLDVESTDGKFTFNADRDSLFYLATAYASSESTVHAFSITSPTPPATALINGNSFYGIGVDPATNILYVGVAPSYQSQGTVVRYNTHGELIDDFPVGIAPNSFIFQ